MRLTVLAALAATVISFTGCSSPTPTHVLRIPPTTAQPPSGDLLAPAPPPLSVEIGDGTQRIGPDIQAGQYRTPGPAAGGIGICFWARLSGLGGTVKEIIANGIVKGPTTVAIDVTDIAFRSDGCQPWVRLQDQR